MRYCSFVPRAGNPIIRPGKVIGDKIEELNASSMMEVISREGEADSVCIHNQKDIRFVAPIQNPSKIICVGLNYREHIKELGHQFPQEPVIFSKPSSSIIGPGERIILPKASEHIDYEGEVAIIIGKKACKVKDARPFIFGFTCINDVTARDIQRRSQDWTRAKGFDTFAPMGPTINTERPAWIRTVLNDKQVQSSQTSDMIFGFDELVINISHVMTLNPGDIVATGTPFGVGKLSSGDKIVIEADGMGRLQNIVSEE